MHLGMGFFWFIWSGCAPLLESVSSLFTKAAILRSDFSAPPSSLLAPADRSLGCFVDVPRGPEPHFFQSIFSVVQTDNFYCSAFRFWVWFFPFCLWAHPLSCHFGSFVCQQRPGPAGDGRPSPRWLAASSSCLFRCFGCRAQASVWAFGVSAGVSIVLSEKHREAFVHFVLLEGVQFTLMLSSCCDRPRQQFQLFFTAHFAMQKCLVFI